MGKRYIKDSNVKRMISEAIIAFNNGCNDFSSVKEINEYFRKEFLESHSNSPSKMVASRVNDYSLRETKYCGGHSTVKSRKHLVSGIVRAKLKKESTFEIEMAY